jgi:outer membrane protein assembly factor BamB
MPCDDMGGLDPEAPWPMTGRCPSRASFIGVTGPASPQVLWTHEERVMSPGGAIDGSENVYVQVLDVDHRAALQAFDRLGSVIWKTLLAGDLWLSPTLGRDGVIYYTSLEYETMRSVLTALDRGTGSFRFELDFSSYLALVGGYQEVNPVIAADGSIRQGSGNGFVAVSPAGELLWSAWASDSGQALLDGAGNVITSQLRGWDLGYLASEVVRFGAQGAREALNVVEGHIADLVLDPDGNRLLLATAGPTFGSFSLQCLSPDGQLRWTYLDVGPQPRCTLAVDDLRRTHLACSTYADGQNLARAWLFDPEGVVLWETQVPDVWYSRGQIIVDQQGTTYLAGGTADETARVWAVSAQGAERWSLTLPGETATLLGMSHTGRLYVGTDVALVALGDGDD